MDSTTLCVICLTEIEELSLELNCGHYFHKLCILDFVKSERRRLEELYHETDDELRPQLDLNVRCPICRNAIEEDGVLKE